MNLYRLLQKRVGEGKPVFAALIGAGKFGSMFLSQARRTKGLQVAAVADLSPERARESLARTGWPAEQYAAKSASEARKTGGTFVTEDAMAAIGGEGIEVVIDATGHPASGIRHVLACCTQGRHIVMVNVEADALAGPLLASMPRKPVSSILSRTATSRRSFVKWWTGHGLEASRWWQRERAPSTFRPIMPPLPRRCGATTALRRRWWPRATSTPRCSTPFLTAPRAPSRWPLWPTPQD